MKPDFMTDDLYNSKLSAHCIAGFYVDNITPASFISRCKREGNEIPFTYRPMKTQPEKKCKIYLVRDVLKMAEKLKFKVTELKEESIDSSYGRALASKKPKLSAEVAYLESKISQLKSEINSLEPIVMKSKAMGFALPSYKRVIGESVSIDGGLACGVYFLLLNDEVVYVGQSVNVYSRIQQHISESSKEFNAFSFFQCEKEKLDELEKIYIRFFDPIFNISHSPSNSGCLLSRNFSMDW